MTNAPERIWIDDARTYSATFFSAGIPYVRADIHSAEIERLTANQVIRNRRSI